MMHAFYLIDRLVVSKNLGKPHLEWRSVKPHNYSLFSPSRSSNSLPQSEQSLLWHGQTPQTKPWEEMGEYINETPVGAVLMRDRWVDGSSSTGFPFITVSCYIGTGWSPKPCLVHWGMSGQAGLLIYLSDHHSPLRGCHCVLSLFIKIGIMDFFQASVLAERDRDQRDVKGHMRLWMNVFPFTCHLYRFDWLKKKKKSPSQ